MNTTTTTRARRILFLLEDIFENDDDINGADLVEALGLALQCDTAMHECGCDLLLRMSDN